MLMDQPETEVVRLIDKSIVIIKVFNIIIGAYLYYYRDVKMLNLSKPAAGRWSIMKTLQWNSFSIVILKGVAWETKEIGKGRGILPVWQWSS
jgi:hypothetical protein